MKQPLYHLTTFGCQMNEHDSERIRGVLEENGWQPADDPEAADLLVFNTCSVRESAENRLLGRLGEASRLKKERPERLIALAGCFAQSRQAEIFQDLPFLDIAFGPSNIGELPALVDAARESELALPRRPLRTIDVAQRRAALAAAGPLPRLGAGHDRLHQLLQLLHRAQCPRARTQPPGRRTSSDEVRRLVDDGVVEVTLLGPECKQLWPRPRWRRRSRHEFCAVFWHELDAIDGLRRIRFTTSHPKDLSPELIEAIRDLPSVCEHLHLPVQSGSNRILERMNRGYTREHYLELVD